MAKEAAYLGLQLRHDAIRTAIISTTAQPTHVNNDASTAIRSHDGGRHRGGHHHPRRGRVP
jgi:hypothetical protein